MKHTLKLKDIFCSKYKGNNFQTKVQMPKFTEKTKTLENKCSEMVH